MSLRLTNIANWDVHVVRTNIKPNLLVLYHHVHLYMYPLDPTLAAQAGAETRSEAPGGTATGGTTPENPEWLA